MNHIIGDRQPTSPTYHTVASGSLGEGIAGAASVTLAILALVGVLPQYLLPISVISVGVAFLFQGGAISARYTELMHQASAGWAERYEAGGGMTAEFFGGLTGVALGILALLGVVPSVLLPVAAVVYGATLLSSARSTTKLWDLMYPDNKQASHVARESASSAAGLRGLVGIAAATLGILALVGIAPLPLTIVAILTVGASDLLSWSAVGSKMVHVFGH